MRVLMIYPIFPKSFWSFDEAIRLQGHKAMMPPLGLITVAAMLPKEWEIKLVDRNVRKVTEDEWEWADLVMMSAMIVQKEDLLGQIREAKRRGKPVAIGGPYPTALPAECAEADYLVLDEAEITLPSFLDALERGDKKGTFRSGGEKPDVQTTPVPRFELLELNAYSQMCLQFSRGCPFQCEFCDIIVLYGRKPRTKKPQQMVAEIQALYDLGWRRSVFIVDDNFIGNKKLVKEFLRELQPWMIKHGYPFSFATEASLDIARDQELMDMMVQCNFGAIFLGIETPDEDSLQLTKKTQNMRDPLADSVVKIARSGLRVMAGFIVGFDNEKPGAGQRIVDFVEKTTVPTAVFSMLQALPGTALWERLEREGRLLEGREGDINQTTLMNFVPTRPIEQIAREHMEGFWSLYDPGKYLDRLYRHYLLLGEAKYPKKPKIKHRKTPAETRALLTIFWRQGFVRNTRLKFWHHLYKMWRLNPGGLKSFISISAHTEHFLDYRKLVNRQVTTQLAQRVASRTDHFIVKPPPPAKKVVQLTINAPARVAVAEKSCA